MGISEVRTLSLESAGLVHQVAQVLTEAILEGKFKGGERLGETELQSHFCISRSPLREAFRELEKQGLVTIIPRKGTFVKKITRKDIEENFPVRAELEGLAARMAAVNMSADNIEEMEECLGKMEDASIRGDIREYFNQHIGFHEVFIEASGNELLFLLLKNIRMQHMWHRFSYRYYQEDLRQAFEVHKRIMKLFKTSPPQPEAVGRMVKWHIEVALERFLAYVDQQE